MPKTFKLTMPNPCHEKWSDFTPTNKGRFCQACKTEVIDFTNFSEEEIKLYFLNTKGSTCGRFRKAQLKAYNYESQCQPAKKWVALLAVVSLLNTKEAKSQQIGKSVRTEQTHQHKSKPNIVDQAEQWKITGTVRDDQSVPVPGVNVVREGTTDGTVTDVDGKFSLTIKNPQSTETLWFSFVGYASVKLAIDAPKDIDVKLEPDLTGFLGEIVVGGVHAEALLSPKRLWRKVKHVFRK